MLIAVFIAAYTLWTQQQVPENVPPKLISAVPIEASAHPVDTPLVTPIPNLGMPEIVPAVLAAVTTKPQPTETPSNKTVINSSQPVNTPTVKPSTSPTTEPTATASATTTASSTPTVSPSPVPSTSPTPTPTTPKPTVKPVSQTELDGLFTKYADEYKVDKEQLKRIAKCESGFNTNAKNLYYGGLFQFSEASWKGYRKQMGKNTDPELRYDPEAAINTAAYLISTGRAGAWPNCK